MTYLNYHICNCSMRPEGSIALCTNCGGDVVMRKPDVIKAAMSVGKQETNVYERQIWNEAIEDIVKIPISAGRLIKGDIVTFEGVPYYSWRKWLWYHIRYMRHNNPMFKPVKLRQFIVL